MQDTLEMDQFVNVGYIISNCACVFVCVCACTLAGTLCQNKVGRGYIAYRYIPVPKLEYRHHTFVWE